MNSAGLQQRADLVQRAEVFGEWSPFTVTVLFQPLHVAGLQTAELVAPPVKPLCFEECFDVTVGLMFPKTFTALLQKGTHKGSWTRVVMPDSAEYFGTRGNVKVKGTIDSHSFEGTFIPMGGGTHMLPVKAEIRKLIGKDAGDMVTITISERISE